MLKCGKELSNSICKKIVSLIILAGILLLPSISFADGGDLPCGDPTTSTPCPLDTWVWMLAVAAAILGAIYLQHKQKLQSRLNIF
jgi:hypothetical protein